MVDKSKRAFLRGAPAAAIGGALAAPALAKSIAKRAKMPRIGMVTGLKPGLAPKSGYETAVDRGLSMTRNKLIDKVNKSLGDVLFAKNELNNRKWHRHRPAYDHHHISSDLLACKSIRPWAAQMIEQRRIEAYDEQIKRLSSLEDKLRDRIDRLLERFNPWPKAADQWPKEVYGEVPNVFDTPESKSAEIGEWPYDAR